MTAVPMSTIQVTSGEAPTATVTVIGAGAAAAPPCKMPPHCRRKMKRVCCCLTILLILNLLLTMHIAHEMCSIWQLFGADSDMLLVPGGSDSFCNDFCVDLCVLNVGGGDDTATVYTCDLTSCLTSCKGHFSHSSDEESAQQQQYVEYDEYYTDTDSDTDTYEVADSERTYPVFGGEQNPNYRTDDVDEETMTDGSDMVPVDGDLWTDPQLVDTPPFMDDPYIADTDQETETDIDSDIVPILEDAGVETQTIPGMDVDPIPADATQP